MYWITTIQIIAISCILTFIGFIFSFILPQYYISDVFINLALFTAATSGLKARLNAKKNKQDKIWILTLVGVTLFIIGAPLKFDSASIITVIGALLFIFSIGYYLFYNRMVFFSSRWIWFLPFILTGCLFKLMHWPGGNIIIFLSYSGIIISIFIQLFQRNYKSPNEMYNILLQLLISISMVVLYIKDISLNFIIVLYLYTWLGLLDLLFQED